MNILHVDCETGWRGGQQQIANLNARLYERGENTAIVCPPQSRLLGWAKDKGIPAYPVKVHGEWDLWAARQLALVAKEHSSDFLLTHSGKALAIGLLSTLFYKPPVLLNVRRVDFHIRANFLSRYKYTHNRVCRIVCISQAIAGVMTADGIPEQKLTVIHSAVDENRFANLGPVSRASLGLPQDRPIIGTVAALTGHKDYPNLIRAATMVLKKHPEALFVAIGPGRPEDETRIKEQAASLGDSFRFLGFKQNVGEYIKAMDIFVLASRQEGLGTTLLDASLLGCPVVATRAGGIPEIVEDGFNGLLVPSEHSQALAEALNRLLDDSALRKRLGQNGPLMAARFTTQVNCDKYLKLFRELLKQD